MRLRPLRSPCSGFFFVLLIGSAICGFGATSEPIRCFQTLSGLALSSGSFHPDPTEAFFVYLRRLHESGLLPTERLIGFLAELEQGNLVNPLATLDRIHKNLAENIHFDQLQDFLDLGIDKPTLLQNMKVLLQELKVAESETKTVREETLPIYKPENLANQFGDFVLREWYMPPEGLPIFSALKTGSKGTYVIDLNTQMVDHLTDDFVSKIGFLRKRDGTVLCAYREESGLIKITDFNKEIASFRLESLFGLKNDPGVYKFAFYENSMGHVNLYIQTGWSSTYYYVYSVNDQTHFVLRSTDGEGFADPEKGRFFARKTYSPNASVDPPTALQTFYLTEYSTGVEVPVFDVDFRKDLGTLPDTYRKILRSGKMVFVASGSNRLIVFDLLGLRQQTFHLDIQLFAKWPLIDILDNPDGSFRVVLLKAKKPDENWELAVVDENSKLKSILLPDSVDLKQNNLPKGRNLPDFLSVVDSTGRVLLFGLATESSSISNRNQANFIYVIDTSTGDAANYDIGSLDVDQLKSVRRYPNGQILGFFTRNDRLRIVQLMKPGPSPQPEPKLTH